MDWTQLSITVDTKDTDTAAAIAQMVAGGGIYIEDYSDLEEQTLAIARIDLIDEELRAKDKQKSIIHLYVAPDAQLGEYIRFVGDRLTAAGITFSLTTDSVRELDWSTAWKQYYHPIVLSDRIAVCPTWEEYSPAPGQQVIRLDPGMAFGTGTHETTRLCLLLVEEYLQQGDAMLDVGCGSGILAICAKLLGAGRTVGVDIDPVAVRTAADNCSQNNCDIELVCGDLATDINGSFDLIAANIVADAILRLAPDIPKLLTRRGVCIFSGIIDSRKDEVLAGVTACGLTPFAVREENGWVAIAARRQEE